MRNHIVFKFLAFCLCCVMLLSAIGSGLALLALAARGLDGENTIESVYEENAAAERNAAAREIVGRYVSAHIGGCPQSMINDFYGYTLFNGRFRPNTVCYSVYSLEGDLLETNYDGRTDLTEYQIYMEKAPYFSVYLTQSPNQPMQASVSVESSAEAPVVIDSENARESYLESVQNSDVASMVDTQSVEVYRKGSTYLNFVRDYSSGYMVHLYMAPGALSQDTEWSALRIIWNYRIQLAVNVGVSLLLFAVFAVYLCCTAGRSPGSTEIRPGGLNRLPIDFYFVLSFGFIATVVAMAVAGYQYLMRQGISIATPIFLYGGLSCCVMFVGFCYAFVAQIQAPNAYMWHNSVTGRLIRLIGKIPGWMRKLILVTWRLTRRISKAAVVFATWAVLQIKKFLNLIRRFLQWLFTPVRKTVSWCYRILPLTWQWILVAGVLMLMLMYAFRSYRLSDYEIWLVLAVCITVVIYAANSFGSLLETVKKMRTGDLNAKVDGRLMVGGYREFADELNGLGNVAYEAAQNYTKSEKMKSELITNVTHDIKTPLTSIISSIDLLRRPHTEEQGEEYLATLERQSSRMKKLVEDLIEVSKAASGSVSVDIVSLDYVEMLVQALGEFSDRLENAELKTVTHLPEQPLMVSADGQLLWRVLNNLLSNAVKYAMPGTRLYVDLKELGGNTVLSLKNTSRDELNVTPEELMERFVRGDASRNTEGSGLGLNIAKGLVEAQGGKMQLMVDGDNFKVTITLPCAETDTVHNLS